MWHVEHQQTPTLHARLLKFSAMTYITVEVHLNKLVYHEKGQFFATHY